jgi:cardiolipin synthase
MNNILFNLTSFINFDLKTLLTTIIYITLSILTSIHILLNKDDVNSAGGWIALVFLSPFIGTILYIFLGINRVKRKGFRLRKTKNLFEKCNFNKDNIFNNLQTNHKQLITFGYNVYQQNFTFGNVINPLQNGTEAYPEMLKEIKNSKKEILISSYIFDYDNETKKFIENFKIATKNGVKIKILIDGIGSLKFFHRSIEKKLTKINGLEFAIFLPPQIPITLPFVNLRNHRKIIIIDGKIAFFGGMNLSKHNVLVNDLKNGILDLTFKIEGPVIEQIIEVFKSDWEFTTGKAINSKYNIDKNFKTSEVPARIIQDGPDNKTGSIELIIHGAINSATKKILIVTPYFLPENNILTAIQIAAMKNINVEIIIPKKSDCYFINLATEANFIKLLNCGVKIYQTNLPFDHSKIFVVDDEWIFVGSSNWDVRSFKLNFESNIEIFSKSLAKKLTDIAEKKKKKAKQVTLNEYKNISLIKRIRNNACRLLTPYS